MLDGLGAFLSLFLPGFGGQQMGTTEREPWVTYLEGDILNQEGVGGERVYQVVIRLQASGLMAVLKARKGGEYLVQFCGAGGFRSLAAKIRNRMLGDEGNWQADRYPPT